MRAITLWEPWATLMVIGAKRNETRPRRTNVHGPLVIHAAQRWTDEQRKIAESEPFSRYLRGIDLNKTLGRVIGEVSVYSCCQTEHVLPNLTPVEYAFGDYRPGRFAWLTSHPIYYPNPQKFTGKQGFFNVPDELIELAREVR